ncbi:MAG: hypothetical protein A2252_06205 [Elusimicrobia bacterium RIFOXYA2_FULL_39_19]|nr:MAG: hypothetical protein A2252_06205 [Elusimicrobia bacterium RIFOXYA2_FULL_39_19]
MKSARNKFSKVFQFKITLNEVTPLVWRRIQIPENYTFWDFHVAIQDSMGWLDYHLHEFTMLNSTTGKPILIALPDPDKLDDRERLLDWEQYPADYFSFENRTAWYVYDFGDNWEHTIEFEGILVREKDRKYPICTDGQRACPPEDVGSVSGYERFLEIIKDPKHEEHKEMIKWAGSKFDPDQFDPKKVKFSNPQTRLIKLFDDMRHPGL